MAGEKLHEYDLWLCSQVKTNIGPYMVDPKFVMRVREKLGSGNLFDYLLNFLNFAADQERLLLNDSELDQLLGVFEPHDAPFLFWTPSERPFKETVAEVSAGLSGRAGKEWSIACRRFSTNIKRRTVCLLEGIEIIRDWVGHLRTLLRGMNATAFLPCPEGQWPTPTCSTPNSRAGAPESAVQLNKSPKAGESLQLDDALPLSRPLPPKSWIKIFSLSWDTLKKRFVAQVFRNKKLSDKSYQVVIADIPAEHQARFRGDQG